MAQISSSSQQNMCPRVLLSPCTTSPTQLSSTTMTKTITNANGRIRAKNEEENKRSGNGYKERDEGRTEGRKERRNQRRGNKKRQMEMERGRKNRSKPRSRCSCRDNRSSESVTGAKTDHIKDEFTGKSGDRNSSIIECQLESDYRNRTIGIIFILYITVLALSNTTSPCGNLIIHCTYV